MPPLSPPELLAQAELIVCEAYVALQEAFRLMLGTARRLTVISTLQELDPLLQRCTPPHLVIVDVDQQSNVLPHLTDLTARYPNLTIFLIAGSFSLEFQQAAVQLGIMRFQTKPWNTAHFIERVDMLLRGYALNPIQRSIIHIYNPVDQEEPVNDQ